MARSDKLRELGKKFRRAAKFESHAYWRSQPIDSNAVLYESFSGNGMNCNPRALFDELLADPEFGYLRHIWALRDESLVARARADYQGSHVKFVVVGSSAYYRALATSKYLVNNATFPPQFAKRQGQVYLNTWHGTPLKRMGYDIPGGGPATRNIIRNFVQADYLISSSPFMTEQMYATGYRLRGIFRGNVLESGYPRVDRQFDPDAARRRVNARLAEAGIYVGDRRLILFAPTWRGDFYRPQDLTAELFAVTESLQAAVDADKYLVLLKTHQAAHDAAASNREASAHLVPNDIVTNDLLAVSELLITDYSSIFYDFLPTRRPVVFYTSDLSEYEGSRGLYTEPDELPGPVTTSIADLRACVAQLVEEGYNGLSDEVRRRYNEHIETYAPYEDGAAGGRVIDTVFRGRKAQRTISGLENDGRQSLLIYLGGMRSNGITTSALSLLSNLDPAKFDVSAFYAAPSNRDTCRNEAAIPDHVRLFPRIGGFNGSKRLRHVRRVLFDGTHRKHDLVDQRELNEYFRDEWYRCFGDSKFDAIVDFSGYGPMWSNILLAGPAKRHSIWLHNDLAADARREVDGERLLERDLRAVFSTYSRFDRLVSVSPALAQLNRESLSGYASSERFVAAENTIAYRRVIEMAGVEPNYGKTVSEAVNWPAGEVSARTALSLLEELYGIDGVAEEIDRRRTVRTVLGVDDEISPVRFITAGRLSPEKNHERLIRAFVDVHKRHPQTTLAIQGDGPLRRSLEDLCRELGVTDSVRLAGFQANPYAAMAAADCFVLSSDYEGQPMVILESRVLDVPVVTTRFGSADGALRPGDGLVVDCSVEGLVEGMEAFIERRVPTVPFNPETYNEAALRSFVAAVFPADSSQVDYSSTMGATTQGED